MESTALPVSDVEAGCIVPLIPDGPRHNEPSSPTQQKMHSCLDGRSVLRILLDVVSWDEAQAAADSWLSPSGKLIKGASASRNKSSRAEHSVPKGPLDGMVCFPPGINATLSVVCRGRARPSKCTYPTIWAVFLFVF